ncbi:MAG: gamma-glutamylcyclotransferase [Thalassobius sp.]|uniref:hypothetical protein n=1 Tax=uncultured Alteromonas sp. TaxID=179113 RepID=UPI000B650C86|nr:gamma-glutamylcyclotransferase [Thalassovita sp.]OUX84043.1 MAG: hypothetical protein CBB95_17820 [Alteromonas sp. TMED35]|tara:strand:+ start:57307 stop:57531 length:225 start_codon:yes stop_codon:yes gene_type:complete
MLDTFAGATNKHCQRCYQQATSHIMSMFNTEMICMSCKDKEKRHPDYPAAQAAEREAVQKGNYNFEGIGKPADL